MTYQVLARKYRPANFEELEGQEHVMQALINALDNNRLHHAYLFTGTRGVGKTTIARILAKCLNCEEGVTSKPCGKCGSCVEIAEGRSVDLIEYDAASRTKVEDTREILDNVQYMPTRCRYKVYLIDEVHMLSNHSFNALLKTLEEPPEHVKFLLATTDPKKLPITVLSRCLQFNLKNISPERIVSYLKIILPKEQVEFEESALWQLGRAADGSMRDALSLTDQAINYGNNSVRDDDVRQMLGSIDQQEVYGLLNCLIEKDAAALLDRIKALAEYSPDYSALLGGTLSILHRIAVAQAVPDAVDNSQGDKEQIMSLADAMSRAETQLYYQIGLIGQRDLPLAPDARTGLEMVLLRMLAFKPDIEDPKKKVLNKAAEKPAATTPATTPATSSSINASTNSASAQSTGAAVNSPERINSPERTNSPERVNSPERTDSPERTNTPETRPEAAARPASPPATESPAPRRRAERKPEPEVELEVAERFDLSPENWAKVLPKLGLIGVTQSVAANSVVIEASIERCEMLLNEDFASLWNNTHQKRIENALQARYQHKMRVNFEIGKLQSQTPADIQADLRREAQDQAVGLMQNDGNVKKLIEHFNGTLDLSSISAREQKGRPV